MKQTILVIGATGTVGSQVVQTLRSQGHNVREATSKKVTNSNQVHINLSSGEGRSEAFKGVDGLFFLSPGGYTNQVELLLPLIDEAKRQNIKKAVFMSAMGANATDEAPLRKVEIALEKSGLNYNIIRPNWFFQNFNTYWLHDIQTSGKILVPAGSAKVSFIDVRDIAAVAAKLLTSSEWNNQAFDLTGPEAIDHAQVAKVISEVSGKKITYEEVTPSDFKGHMMKLGVSNDYADVLNYIFGFLKQGYAAPVLDSVQKITGQKPRDVRQYANDYKQHWM